MINFHNNYTTTEYNLKFNNEHRAKARLTNPTSQKTLLSTCYAYGKTRKSDSNHDTLLTFTWSEKEIRLVINKKCASISTTSLVDKNGWRMNKELRLFTSWTTNTSEQQREVCMTLKIESTSWPGSRPGNASILRRCFPWRRPRQRKKIFRGLSILR